jgi:UDP-N-acetylglucosamine 2-epimerase (hydrolysing)
MKKILFLTGTRADYWKLISLIKPVDEHPNFESHVFVTGMHMLSKYGFTADEVIAENHQNIYLNINQFAGERPELVLANTIRNLSQYVHEISPDLLVIHGDRVEALAWAIVGVFSNILVAHIEGGESSGSMDESIRHSISKLSHVHFTANHNFAKKLEQFGENPNNIYPIWSPDFDVILSGNLPTLEDVKTRYNIPFDDYGIFIFHSVTTEVWLFEKYSSEVIKWLVDSRKKFVIVYPNNDPGSDIVLRQLKEFSDKDNFDETYRIFHSVLFNDFLTLLKNAKCIMWNSSVGVRQAPVLGVPTVNVWTRQNNRNNWESIHNVGYSSWEITNKINELWDADVKYSPCFTFWDWKASERFMKIIETDAFWKTPIQK